jgi:hypothetical protein
MEFIIGRKIGEKHIFVHDSIIAVGVVVDVVQFKTKMKWYSGHEEIGYIEQWIDNKNIVDGAYEPEKVSEAIIYQYKLGEEQ